MEKSYSLLNLLMPEKHICFRCGVYDKAIGKTHLCRHCESLLEKNKGLICDVCGKPLENTRQIKCMDCRGDVKFYKRAFAPFIHTGYVRDLIMQYKFAGKSYYYKMFGEYMLTYMREKNIRDDCQIEGIVSVPMTLKSEVLRGYNQADLLAKYISKAADIYYNSNSLIKMGDNAIQSTLSGEDRRENVKKIFKTAEKGYILNKHLLLVDDILTTGFTVDECSRVLLEAGALSVTVLTISTGFNR